VQVDTRAYFAVVSDLLSVEVLVARIGAEPTRAVVAGERRAWPPLPAANHWTIDSGLGKAEPLWRHLEALRQRVEPLAAPIGLLCADEPGAALRIVREFQPGDEQADLGFWLDEGWLDLLRRTGAVVDVDEYDYTSS
jgi:Domain of unknown function (DUF4279)